MTCASPIITRFAPSPSGELHLGSVRTALVAWAYARQHQGKFIVRIEDTDPARSSARHVAEIERNLAWLGLTADKQYHQSARAARHCTVAHELRAGGQAYESDGALRLKITGTLARPFVDLIAGPISVAAVDLTDPVLLRGDGTPTYFLANALDDLDDGISHVIRGDDHLINTVKQLYLFEALKVPPPAYAHLPMLLAPEGGKLSKRTAGGTVPSVRQLQSEGFLPAAVLNYLARLSWAHGDQEIFTPDFFVAQFSFAAVSRAGARFDFAKLKWLNAQHLKKTPAATLWALAQLPALSPAIANLIIPRAHTLKELRELAEYFIIAPPGGTATEAAPIVELQRRWAGLADWSAGAIKTELQETARQHNIKFADFAREVRLILTGRTVSPDLSCVAEALGNSETLARLTKSVTTPQ